MKTLFHYLFVLLTLASVLLGADLTGKWDFVWQTPGGERKSTLSFKQTAERVEVLFPEAKEPITGTFRDGKLSATGRLFSSEAGETAEFHMEGTLTGSELKGTGGWGEHQLTFTARKAE